VGTLAGCFSYLYVNGTNRTTNKTIMEPEVTVNDPVYIVRRRLGQKLNRSGSREEEIQNMANVGAQVDSSVSAEIREDYQSEVEDALSDMQGDMGLDGMSVIDKIENAEQDPEEDKQEKIEKYMRVSSLQLAFQAYPVFKSMVVN